MATAASSQQADDRANKRLKGDDDHGGGGEVPYPPQPHPGQQQPMPHQPQQQRYLPPGHYGGPPPPPPPAHMPPNGTGYGWGPHHQGYPQQPLPSGHAAHPHHPHSWGGVPMAPGGYPPQQQPPPQGGGRLSPDRGLNWNGEPYRGRKPPKQPPPPQVPPPPHGGERDDWGAGRPYWAHQTAGSPPNMPPGMYPYGPGGAKSPPRGSRGRHDMMGFREDGSHYLSTRTIHDVDDGASSSAGGSGKDKGRGSYKCGRCGVPKKGHVCPYQPKVKRRPDEPPVETRSAAVQVELDEFMTLRRLNIRIQGFPESYVTEPYMGDSNVVGEPHPISVAPPSAMLQGDDMMLEAAEPQTSMIPEGSEHPLQAKMSPPDMLSATPTSHEIGVGDEPVEVAASSVPAEVSEM